MGVKSFFSVILEHELENGDIDKLIQDIASLIASKRGIQKVEVNKPLPVAGELQPQK